MPLETAAHIAQLVDTNPSSSDGLNQGDDHIRLIKQVLVTDIGASMTNGAVTAVDGTSSAPAIGFAADATAGFYRPATGQIAAVGSLRGLGSVPIGAFIDYGGPTAPAGYLACDGQAVPRATYPDLYTALGGAASPWGQGDGTTTFNVPALMSRYRRHRDTVGGPGGSVGTLQAADTAPHTHAVTGNTGTESAIHTHTFAGNTGNMSANGIINPTFNNSVSTYGNYQTYTSGQAIVGPRFNAGSDGTFAINALNIDHYHAFSGTTNSESAAHSHAVNLTSGSSGGTETRPLSATVLVCVRAL